MNKYLFIVIFLLFNSGAFAQEILNIFSQKGKIFLQYTNKKISPVTTKGVIERVVDYSLQKKIIVFTRIIGKKEYSENNIIVHTELLNSVNIYNLISQKEELLFTTVDHIYTREPGEESYNHYTGTKPSYANSELYPFDNIESIENITLSPDGNRIYFSSKAWVICNAVHYYDLKAKRLVFFQGGDIIKIYRNSVELEVAGLTINKGIYLQRCLFDLDGKVIAELTPKDNEENIVEDTPIIKVNSKLEMSGWKAVFAITKLDPSSENGRIIFQAKVDDQGDLVSLVPLEKTVSPSVIEFYKKQIEENWAVERTRDNANPPPISSGRYTVKLNK